MWNDTDIPLAYLITFRCYGTWLPGDERGSIDRFNNIYQTPYKPANKSFAKFNRELLKGDPVSLNFRQREVIEKAIREVCDFRNWILRAINVRTNHVHIVISINDAKPGKALNGFKAYSTRKMRENGCWQFEYSPWSNKGSKRYLWNERSIETAVNYVINGQGGELPDFD
jgi:REP element-mobilizing transposase RayT